jgi:hypothetical protein
MTKFIRLSNIVINTAYINRINITPTKYTINLMSNHKGDMFGSAMFFWGSLSPSEDITINIDTTPKDYDKISSWLDKNVDN